MDGPLTRDKWGVQPDGTYRNPILNADYSDPDIVRVGNKYYMISSTMQLTPGMAILESEDLINWKTIHHCLPNLEQLDSRFDWRKMNCYNEGVYAGSLRYLEWKEKAADGSLVPKSQWFMHATLFGRGIIVATADDIYGKWKVQFMKDRFGRELTAPHWDDNCPYWEFNSDGTLKAAYMIASKPHDAWYLHIFEMSLDGTTLLDGDFRFMSHPGDTVRKRSGETPDSLAFSGEDSGDPRGKLLDRDTGEILPEADRCGFAHDCAMNEWGDLLSIERGFQYPNREGTVISDICSAEASKIIRFGPETEAGQLRFTGRHGTNQQVSDYVYIFSSEYWDGIRIPLLRRAKNIYGDRFDQNGQYIGSGSKGNPGAYETQRICVNTCTPFDMREPNQGGYVDIPAQNSIDGKEHWYWLTQHGNNFYGPECRPTSLLPVTWVEGWPMVGALSSDNDFRCTGKPDPSASPYDGTGLENCPVTEIHHPQQKFRPGVMTWTEPLPPIRGASFARTFFQGTAPLGGEKLSPVWQWNYSPRKNFWILQKNALRLFAFESIGKKLNFFGVGNCICQRYLAASHVTARISLSLEGMADGQQAGLAHFDGGEHFSAITVLQKDGKRYLCSDLAPVSALPEGNTLIFRTCVDDQAVSQFSYSVDGGKTFTNFGPTYQLRCGGYRGDMIGFFTFNDSAETGNMDAPGADYPFGYADFSDFQYEYTFA